VAFGVEQAASLIGGAGVFAQGVRLALAIVSGLLALAAAAALLGISEFGEAVALLRARLPRRQRSTGSV